MNRGRPEGQPRIFHGSSPLSRLQACPAPERAPWSEDGAPTDVRIALSLLRAQLPDCARAHYARDSHCEVFCRRCQRLVFPYRLPPSREST
jgi:hypothetical protein